MEKAVDRQLRALATNVSEGATPRTVRARARSRGAVGVAGWGGRGGDSTGLVWRLCVVAGTGPSETNRIEYYSRDCYDLTPPRPQQTEPLLRPRLRDRDLHRSRWSAASSPMTWSPARGKRHASSAPVAARRPLRALPPSAMPPLGSRAPHTSFDQYSEGARASPVHALVLPGSAQVQQQPAASASRD